MNEQPPSMAGRTIPEQIDLITQDLATYGSAYQEVKSTQYLIDKMIEVAEDDYARSLAACYGDRAARVMDLLRHRPYIVAQERPRTSCLEELHAVRAAQEIYRKAATITTLKQYRIEVDAYGAMRGGQEFGANILSDGLHEDIVRDVMRTRASKGLVNSYESVRNMRDGIRNDHRTESERRLDRVAEMVLMANEYIRSENEYPQVAPVERDVRRTATPEAVEPVQIEREEDDGDNIVRGEIDMSILRGLDDHILVSGIEEESHDVDTPEPESASDEEEVEHIERMEIAPVSTSMDDAAKALDDNVEGVERIGPMCTTMDEAADVIDMLFARSVPSLDDDYAQWYRTNLRHNSRNEVMDVQEEDDGGLMVIMSGAS